VRVPKEANDRILLREIYDKRAAFDTLVVAAFGRIEQERC
jgi:hypothetical protein